MADEWRNQQGALDSPAKQFAAITPHDSANLAADTRGIYVGTGGNIAVVGMDGSVVTFANVPAGTVLPVIARRVNATNTSASNLVALW